MSSLKMTLFFIAALVAVFLCVVEAAEGKSMSASTLSNIDGERGKRQIFDASCRGIYDRGLLGQLERVCEDCYNLYRKPAVATECRRDCYTSEIFESCLRDLMLHEYIDEYKEKAFMVAGRK